MHRRIAYLVVAILTFSLGISAVLVCGFVQGKDISSNELNENGLLLTESPAKQRFTPTNRACKPGWAQIYESSDGETLSESGDGFASPTLANRELQKQVSKAEKIVERAAKLDANGKRVGERVIAIFPANENGIKWVGILWTEKSLLRSIEAPSVQLALEFERTRYNQ